MDLKLKSYLWPSLSVETDPKNSIVENPVIAKYQFQPLKPIITMLKAVSKMQMKLIRDAFYLYEWWFHILTMVTKLYITPIIK